MKTRKLAVVIGMIVLSFSLVAAGCNGANGAASEMDATMEPVLADEKIVAEGQVVPVESATLSFVAGGVVDEIFVDEGEAVAEDAVIAQLSGAERLASQMSSAELALISAQQAYDDLFDTVDIQKAQAEMAVAQARIELEDAEEDREKLNYRNSSDTTLTGIRADAVIAADALKDAEDYYNYFEENYDEDDPVRAAALSQVVAAQKANDRAQYNLQYALGYPEESDLEEADARVAVAIATLDEAEKDLEALQDGKPDSDDVALVEARLKEAQAIYDAAVAALEDIKLISPFDGELVANNLTKGEFVSPGAPAAVVGNMSAWEVETTDLTELDVVKIKEGMEVTVELDALPGVELNGVVSSIKMLGENVQGDITYTVKILLEETEEPITWNMTAFVTFPLD